MWQSYKQERRCQTHIAAWPTHCWKTKKSARDNHVLACNLSKIHELWHTIRRLLTLRVEQRQDAQSLHLGRTRSQSGSQTGYVSMSGSHRESRPATGCGLVSELGSRPRLRTPSGLSPSPRSGLWPGTSSSNLTPTLTVTLTSAAWSYGIFDLPNPNLNSGGIQWNHPFSARIRIRIHCESSFDTNSSAKPEVLSSRMTSHQHYQHRD